ncbi:hypothetical protein [Algicola sagamiensis]|uniref:hypothetical protein n=1 Tax=Algicola sagamiensis TaxID=163869 RepID=UPI0012FA152E|nr:hypothetical protein [Algicola sagamiensis]
MVSITVYIAVRITETKPKLVAEGVLNIEGVTGFVDGEYIVKRVEHEISGSGYRCRVDVEILTK